MGAGPGRCGCVASDAGRTPAGHTPAGSLGVATPRLIPRGERAPGERQAPPCERGSGIKARAVILASGSAVLVDALRGDAGVDEHAITAVCPAALAFLDALGLPSSPPSPSAAASRCSASSRKPHREPGTTGSRATASSSSHRLAGSTLFWSPSCRGGGGPRRTFSRRSTSLPAAVVAMSGMTFEFDTPHGRMMATMLAGIAQFESDLLSERVKSGLAAARARGREARNSAVSLAGAPSQTGLLRRCSMPSTAGGATVGSPATSASARTPSPSSSNGIGQSISA